MPLSHFTPLTCPPALFFSPKRRSLYTSRSILSASPPSRDTVTPTQLRPCAPTSVHGVPRTQLRCSSIDKCARAHLTRHHSCTRCRTQQPQLDVSTFSLRALSFRLRARNGPIELDGGLESDLCEMKAGMAPGRRCARPGPILLRWRTFVPPGLSPDESRHPGATNCG